MTYEIFKTDDYLLVIDNSEIKEGDYRMNLQRGYVKLVDDAPEYYNQRNDVFKRVIAHLPLNNSPILEGVDLLPSLEQEDDVEKMAKEFFKPKLPYQKKELEWNGFIKGYNKAKEKYKYTEEDMLVIRNQLVTMLPTGDISAWDMIQSISKYTKWFDEYIESLSQPKYPIAFMFETEYDCCGRYENCKGCDATAEMINLRPKTTTKSQGQTILVGKYIY